MRPALYLVRHGQSTWNVEGRIQGQTTWPELTRVGRGQARDAAASLRGVGAVALYSSDAVRALQTAEVIGAAVGLRPLVDERLREQHWGVLQGQRGPVASAQATALGPHERVDGGESSTEVEHRVRSLLAAVLPSSGALILVSHGDTIRAAIAVLQGESRQVVPTGEIANGSVTVIVDPAPVLP